MNWLEYGEVIARILLAVLTTLVSFGLIVIEIQWKMSSSITKLIFFLVTAVLLFVAGIAEANLLMKINGGTMFGCVSFIFARRRWHRLHRPRKINSHERPQGFLFSTMREDSTNEPRGK